MTYINPIDFPFKILNKYRIPSFDIAASESEKDKNVLTWARWCLLPASNCVSDSEAAISNEGIRGLCWVGYIGRVCRTGRPCRSDGSAGSEPQTGLDGRPHCPLFGRGFFSVTHVLTDLVKINIKSSKYDLILAKKAGKYKT
ncbi:hypothetical protein BpHYR1_008114 [Brachionus plicatilis]|uniref:Uncharacterized protein n=1 Tax=Brachionus plicatilis TaxID=10195 RepID=A0A3M7R6L5_BRAPC|nr:hypothetical protein BpHYR1_008114 [Brachionus plicatilis]